MGQVLEVVGVESMEEKAVIPNTEPPSLDFYNVTVVPSHRAWISSHRKASCRKLLQATPSLDFFSSLVFRRRWRRGGGGAGEEGGAGGGGRGEGGKEEAG